MQRCPKKAHCDQKTACYTWPVLTVRKKKGQRKHKPNKTSMHNQTSPGRAESVSLRHENFVNRNSQRQVHYHTLARFVQVLPPWCRPITGQHLKCSGRRHCFNNKIKTNSVKSDMSTYFSGLAMMYVTSLVGQMGKANVANPMRGRWDGFFFFPPLNTYTYIYIYFLSTGCSSLCDIKTLEECAQ